MGRKTRIGRALHQPDRPSVSDAAFHNIVAAPLLGFHSLTGLSRPSVTICCLPFTNLRMGGRITRQREAISSQLPRKLRGKIRGLRRINRRDGDNPSTWPTSRLPTTSDATP